jgi:GTP-binding protein EngB required for normal cell division
MTQTNQDFQAAEIGSQFASALTEFNTWLKNSEKYELKSLRNKLHDDLKQYREKGAISVAFVGQYSSGKSTIISALTGKRDIKIDADIATDKTSNYNYNGIHLTDTPGLFTERKDHDAITYEAIDKADLLVFCLTYMLFDSITVENFKKLAYEKGYGWKMMLVINKMSDEAGEEDQKIINYRHSLAEALKPYTLDEFPVCFIDAKDYCEGSDEEDDFLVEMSRFQTFTEALNQFVEKRAALAKLDTPVRIALSYLETAQANCTGNSVQDETFFELLNRLSHVVRKERNRLRIKVERIALKRSADIAQEGVYLASEVGSNENFESLAKQTELNVKAHYEQAEAALQSLFDTGAEDIRREVEQVFQDDLFLAFFAYLENQYNLSVNDVKSGINIEALKATVQSLKGTAQTAGVNFTNFATRSFLNTASKQGFLRSMDVLGSGMHQTVLRVGKFVGFKFKPWQAVGVAKNLGNFARFLGPTIAVFSIGLDIMDAHKERQLEQQMAECRQKITSEFIKVGKDLEAQISIQLSEFEQQVYDEIDQKISQTRRIQEETIAASNTQMNELMQIRAKFEQILNTIRNAS